MYLIMQGHEKWKWSVVLHGDFTTETYWFNHPKRAFEFAVSKAPQCNVKKLPDCEYINCVVCCGKGKWYFNIMGNMHKCDADSAYFEVVHTSGFYSEWERGVW